MMQEPWVSAVVSLAVPANDLASITPAKGYFTAIGYEVHAPLGSSFGIAGPKSLFEKTFNRVLLIGDDELITKITTEEGESELPLDLLPENIREVTESVRFIEPPPLVFGAPGN